jgi:hypothetical protein
MHRAPALISLSFCFNSFKEEAMDIDTSMIAPSAYDNHGKKECFNVNFNAEQAVKHIHVVVDISGKFHH